MQDPLLLDGERRRLSPGLPTAGSRLEERVSALRRLLARQRGETTLSWSCLDITADSDTFSLPSGTTADGGTVTLDGTTITYTSAASGARINAAR